MKKELMAFAGQGLSHAEKQPLIMTSREIAELTDKQHSHVMRDIEQMLAQLGKGAEGYLQNWIHPQNGQTYREYALDREHTECLITGYSAVLRMNVIKRLHELEDALRPQLTLPQALRVALELAEEKEKLTYQLAAAAPKVEFVERYVMSSGSMGFREVAKLLNLKETVLRRFLIDKQVMYPLAGKLTPFACHKEAGRFAMKTGASPTNGHAFTQAKFTPKGVQWLVNLLLEAGVLGDGENAGAA